MKTSYLAGVPVGIPYPVRLMGVINVSPESFYKGSVPMNARALARQATQMQEEGTDFIDLGAMSSAPYLRTQISETEEARRLVWAVKIIRQNSSLPISIDSFRSGPAEAGLEAGGKILNDITGLRGDPRMASVAAHAKGVILMAQPFRGLSVEQTFRYSLRIARKYKIPMNRITLDPGIGFYRNQKLAWWKWDLKILVELKKYTRLGFPLLIGVSRKSFIGKISGGEKPEQRLAGSLAATTVAVMNGASIVRTHDVKTTLEAVRMAEEIRKV